MVLQEALSRFSHTEERARAAAERRLNSALAKVLGLPRGTAFEWGPPRVEESQGPATWMGWRGRTYEAGNWTKSTTVYEGIEIEATLFGFIPMFLVGRWHKVEFRHQGKKFKNLEELGRLASNKPRG